MTKIRRTVAAALAIVAVATALPALAQPAGIGFARADANNDGAVTRAEAAAARQAMFNRLDRNADGTVSAAEIERARSRLAALARMADSAILLRTERMDANGDGTLTRDEFMAKNPMFELADRNGDGVVSQDEISTIRARIAQRRQ